MGNNARILTVLLILLTLLSLGFATASFYLYQNEQKRSMSIQAELDKTNSLYQRLQQELKDANNKVLVLEDELKNTKEKMKAVVAELENEKNLRQASEEKLEKIQSQLNEQMQLKASLEEKLALAQTEVQNLSDKLKELMAKKQDLESEVKSLKTGIGDRIELGKIVVGAESVDSQDKETASVKAVQVPLPQPKEGKILVVNRQYDFAVINLGSRDGIRLGDSFSVYNDNEYIGKITVEKIHDSMAAAGFDSPELKDRIKDGNRVVQIVR